MKTTTYIQNSNEDRITKSVVYYLTFYSDTSHNKHDRNNALGSAIVILDYTYYQLDNIEHKDEGVLILQSAFLKIINKTKYAVIKQNELVDFKNEIGFLKILLDK